MEQKQEYSQEIEEQQSQYSSEDEDGKLLTNKVEEKLLTVVAKLKAKDPNMYNITKPIFDDQDFQEKQKKNEAGNKAESQKKNSKMSYKDLVTKKDKGESEDQQEGDKKELNLDQIKQNFKKKLVHNQKSDEKNQDNDNQQLFKVKKKIQLPKKSNQQKLKQFVSTFDPQSSKMLTNLWKNDKKLDKTDLFLRNYIINQKWKTSKLKSNENQQGEQQMVDQQDEQRSIQMDQYQAKYNFRFQQPGSDKIVQYPRQIPQSMRQKPQSRKQKRKKLTQRKKQQQQQIRKQYQQKKQQKKEQIINKLRQHQHQNHNNNNNKIDQQNNQQSSQFQHDWFFCDDCTKPLQQKQQYYMCNQCGQYMLCQQCHQLIIHKHKMQKAIIPIGAGPPKQQKAQKQLKKLKSCKNCRKKIQPYLNHYQYSQKSSHMLLILCQKCYDQSTLQIKKRYKLIQPTNQNINYQEILDKNPQKIKQLTNQKDIQQLVDQYLKYDFQDIIGGGLKTKFKYINVKPQSYGLSDEQILYGDDKQLNKYISIKKLGAYQDQDVKLRNNMYKRKIKSINKSALDNKRMLNKIGNNAHKLRSMKKIQTRAQLLRKRRQNRNTKLKIINFSNPQNQKKYYIPNSRLASYGLAVQKKDEEYHQNGNQNRHKHDKMEEQ